MNDGEQTRDVAAKAEDLATPPGGATWDEAPGLVARGVCMGTADVVPGVSGGTMALILGIYTRLVHAIKSIDRLAVVNVLRGRFGAARDRVHWRFLGAVVTGQALAIVMFTKVIPLPTLIKTHPEPVYGLFFGLIVGSVFVLGRDLFRQGVERRLILACLAGLVAGLVVVRAVPAETPGTSWFIFLCGCVSICAMILPGISGAFVLLILRQYERVLGALGDFIHPGDGSRLTALVDVVLPFGLGCLIGILAFARLLSWLLHRAEAATLSFMTGLMAGSLWVLWPFQQGRGGEKLEKYRIQSLPRLPETWDGTVALSLVLMGVGLVAVVALDRLARSKGGGFAPTSPSEPRA